MVQCVNIINRWDGQGHHLKQMLTEGISKEEEAHLTSIFNLLKGECAK